MKTNVRLSVLFVLCYLSLFLFPPFAFFLFEAYLVYILYTQQKEEERKIFIRMMAFRPRLKHFLLCLILVPVFFLTYSTKPGFLFFFTIPLGYLFNKARFIGLCVFFYLLLSATEEPGKSRLEPLRRLFHTAAGKCLGLWLIGLLSMTSTLHGTAAVTCPSQKSMVGYEEVLAQNFCAGNFLAREACRHDKGSIYGAAVDSRSGNFFFTHIGKGTQSPLCAYAPQKKFRHKKLPYTASAQRVLFSPSDNMLYVPLLSEPKILAVDSTSFKIKKTYTVSAPALVNAVLDEKRKTLYALSERSVLYKIHLPSGNIKEFSFRQYSGANGLGLALNTQTQMIYATSWLGGTLTRIDAQKLELVDVHRFFPAIMDAAVNEKQNEVYVTRPYPPAVLVLDETTLQIKKKLWTPFGARGALFLKDVDLLAVGNYFNGTVQFFDTRAAAEVFKFDAGPFLRGFTYDARAENAYAFSGCGVYKFPLREIYHQKTR